MAQPYAQLGRGLGTAIGSFFGNPQAQMAGEMAGLQRVALEDKIGQGRAKAAAEAAQAQMMTPEATRSRVMSALGIPSDALPQLQQYQQTGRLPMYEPLPPDEAGPVAARPEYLSPDNLGKYGKMFAAEQAVLAGSAKDLKDYLQGGGLLARSNLEEGIASGAITPQIGGARSAALEGKPLYNFNEFGAGDNFAGTVNTNNPAAQNFAQYRGAQTAAQKANAAQSYAAADASRATADLRRTQSSAVGQGVGKAPSGYRWTTNLETGEPMMEPIPGGPKDPRNAPPAKPMPATALRMQQEELDAIGLSGGIAADLDALTGQIQSGELELGPVENLLSKGKNAAGMSDKNSRNFQSFQATLEKIRNDSLRLNKGVQTEGDAVRAWNEVVANINDPQVVMQRLQEVKRINERAAQLRRMNVETIRANFGHPALDTDSHFNLPPAVGASGPKPGTVQDGYRFKGGNPADAKNWEKV